MADTPPLPEPEKALPVVARLRDALASVTRPIGNMVDRHEAITRRVTAMQEYQSACSFGSIEKVLSHIASLESHLASKDAEIERLRADAERYRWLRMQNWHDGALCVVRDPYKAVRLGFDCPSRERLDEFIDAALAAQGGGAHD